jgi:N-acetylmuramoyl-L-alanine amidase
MRRSNTTGSSASRQPSRLTANRRARTRVPIAVLVAVAVVLVAGGFALGRLALSALSGRMELVSSPEVRVSTGQAMPADKGAGTPGGSASSGMVEVPALVGMRADEAVVVLETAGFKVEFVDVGSPVASEASRVVQAQRPTAGNVLSIDSTVSITVPPSSVGETSTLAAENSPRLVVCIDPGHQAHNDVKLEPVGPGSRSEKPRASGGATGVTTGMPEYEVALQISMNLKKRLEAAGVTVVMTRTTNDVRLSNSERAKMANRAKADLFIRIHGGASTNPADTGITTLYPTKNRWTAKNVAPSRSAAKFIEQSVCRTTGAAVYSVQQRGGMAGFNWAKVPAVAIETGFLSNPLEDKLMASPKYQDLLSEGISLGVLAYLKNEGQ